MSLLYAYFWLAIVLDHAHLACPIALSWGNQRFRAHMLERPETFLLLPVLCVTLPLLIGEQAASPDDPAFRALAWVYGVWNAWHFASQNYGISAISGGLPWQRNSAFVLTVICLLALPLLWAGTLWIVLTDLGISLMHWIMDIRLSGDLARREWLFTAGMLAIGCGGLIFGRAKAEPSFCAPMLACDAKYPNLLLAGLRYGLGGWHFLASRWVWSRLGQSLLAKGG